MRADARGAKNMYSFVINITLTKLCNIYCGVFLSTASLRTWFNEECVRELDARNLIILALTSIAVGHSLSSTHHKDGYGSASVVKTGHGGGHAGGSYGSGHDGDYRDGSHSAEFGAEGHSGGYRGSHGDDNHSENYGGSHGRSDYAAGGTKSGSQGGGSHGSSGHWGGGSGGHAHSYHHYSGPVSGHHQEISWKDKHGKVHHDYVAHPDAYYAYGVDDKHTKDHHSQKEHRDGKTVHGQYEVHEPGGNVRIVKYQSDPHSGFTAHVHNHGGNDHSGGHHGGHKN